VFRPPREAGRLVERARHLKPETELRQRRIRLRRLRAQLWVDQRVVLEEDRVLELVLEVQRHLLTQCLSVPGARVAGIKRPHEVHDVHDDARRSCGNLLGPKKRDRKDGRHSEGEQFLTTAKHKHISF